MEIPEPIFKDSGQKAKQLISIGMAFGVLQSQGKGLGYP